MSYTWIHDKQKENIMNKNNALGVAAPANFSITQKLARPVIRPLYGKMEGVPPASHLSRLSRKEEHCCNRATD
jgi:hypothetical protein